jgi:tetratricopeptide (TPR) repeat protein
MDPAFETTVSAGLSASHAHNEILNTAVSLGLTGLLIYLWLTALCFALIRRAWRQATDENGLPLAALSAGLLAVWINNQFSFHTVTTAAYSAIFLGLLARLNSPERNLPFLYPQGMDILLRATALLFLAISLAFLAASRFSRLAQEAFQKADWRQAVRHAKTALRLDPFSSPYRLELARLLQEGIIQAPDPMESKLFYEASAAQYGHVAGRTPGNALAQNGWGVSLIYAAQRFGAQAYLLEAEKRFRLALEADPYFSEGIANLASCLYLQGKKDEAKAVYKEALDRRPHATALRLNLADFYIHERADSEAIAQLQKILRYDSDHEQAKARLAQIWEKQVE